MPEGPQGQKRPADTVANDDIVALIDAAEAEPRKRGPYKPRQATQISKLFTTNRTEVVQSGVGGACTHAWPSPSWNRTPCSTCNRYSRSCQYR